MTRSNTPLADRGNVHSFKSLDSPPVVCWIAPITRLAPTKRSIAPPIPGANFPGISQFAILPSWLTSRAPRTVAST